MMEVTRLATPTTILHDRTLSVKLFHPRARSGAPVEESVVSSPKVFSGLAAVRVIESLARWFT
jgi:hypothetical protein